MVKKGLIADLSKLTESLDLSLTHTISTINAVLKPLEILLRMANQPGLTTTNAKKNLCAVYRMTPATVAENADSVEDDERQRSQENEDSKQQQDRSNADDTFAERTRQLRDEVDGLDVRIQEIGSMGDLLNHFLERDQSGSTFTEKEPNGNFSMVNEPLEMTSDSDESDDSNATEIEDNDVEVEENEDEADDRSEVDVDEETRQFIEIYDMHGSRMSPSIRELNHDNEDILMIQYAGSENGAGDGNATYSPLNKKI